ncbi:MAG: hypothetical protein HY868_16765 [Chloroflexi bacterium]|nr:hypothetical protein [Chloroflexota bacterium]
MVNHLDLERLVSAGALDRKYRELLMRDPLRAAEGYNSERFHLTPEEKAVLCRIHTDDYRAFVNTVANWIFEERMGYGASERDRVQCAQRGV